MIHGKINTTIWIKNKFGRISKGDIFQ